MRVFLLFDWKERFTPSSAVCFPAQRTPRFVSMTTGEGVAKGRGWIKGHGCSGEGVGGHQARLVTAMETGIVGYSKTPPSKHASPFSLGGSVSGVIARNCTNWFGSRGSEPIQCFVSSHVDGGESTDP